MKNGGLAVMVWGLTSVIGSAAVAADYEAPSNPANAGFNTTSAFTATAPAAAPLRPSSTTVSPPVVMTYSGSSPTLNVSNSGLGKAVQASINNTKNTASALYGQTNGGGAALTGYNSGTTGPAGKFGVTNTASEQPAVTATTVGVGNAVYAASSGTYSVAVQAIGGSDGVYAKAATSGGSGVFAVATDGYGVFGEDLGSGVGIYGSSAHGYAGLFNGRIGATGYDTLSDRNAKTHIEPLDGAEILDKVSRLEVSAWQFKNDASRAHVGPMAQDFHAAFGLNGADDTHINLTDFAGVNLAAVKELSAQFKRERAAKDARLAALEAKLDAQSQVIGELKALTTRFQQRMSVLEAAQAPRVQRVTFDSGR